MSKEQNKATGDLGENIASKFLIENGFKILDRNYKKKFGEIDIVAQKDRNIYFCEVKTNIISNHESVTDVRPEERVDQRKLNQIGKAIRVYVEENKLEKLDWHFRVIAIKFDPEERIARLKIIEDVVPE